MEHLWLHLGFNKILSASQNMIGTKKSSLLMLISSFQTEKPPLQSYLDYFNWRHMLWYKVVEIWSNRSCVKSIEYWKYNKKKTLFWCKQQLNHILRQRSNKCALVVLVPLFHIFYMASCVVQFHYFWAEIINSASGYTKHRFSLVYWRCLVSILWNLHQFR